MLARILVPLDGSTLAERALSYAESLARVTNSRLLLVHFAPPPTMLRPEQADAPLSLLERTAERLRGSGLEVETYVDHAFSDEVARGVVETVRERRVDLVVMSTHGRGLSRLVYGSVADQVLRQAEGLVLLITAACKQSWSSGDPKKIMIALDGSERSERMIGPVSELAALLQSTLLLVRVVQSHGSGHDLAESGPGGRYDEELAATRRQAAAPLAWMSARGAAQDPSYEEHFAAARRYLAGFAEQLSGRGLVVEQHVDVGPPAEMLPTVARLREVGLIAMATHGRGGLARLTLGSVATGTLQRTGVPLLLGRLDSLAPAESD